MTTLSVSIDDKLAEGVRKYAADCETTVDALVTDYLASLATSSERNGSDAVDNLMGTIEKLSRPMGGKTWDNRDELHAR